MIGFPEITFCNDISCRENIVDDLSVRCSCDDQWNSSTYSYFAVYDGHGGVKTAEYLQQHLHKNILNCMTQKKMIERALIDGFLSTDQAILTTDQTEFDQSIGKKLTLSKKQGFSGSTAIVLLLERRHSYSSIDIYVACVGDSRAVLCHKGKAIPLSRDHKATRTDELNRIRSADGFVVNGRLNGILAVSRAFGDIEHKQHGPHLIAVPEVTKKTIASDDQFIILASDGLWDVMSSQEAVNFVIDRLEIHRDVSFAANELINAAYEKGSVDNISCIVVCLNQRFNCSSAAPITSKCMATCLLA